MCTGAELAVLAGAATSAAGAGVNAKIQNNAISAQNEQNRIAMEGEREARIAEEARQDEMERLQLDAVSRALFEANPDRMLSDAKKDEKRDVAVQEFTSAADEYNIPTLPAQQADGPVSGMIGKIVGDALKRTKGILGAQGSLSAMNSERLETQDAIARAAADIRNVGSSRQGSLNAARRATYVPAAGVEQSGSIFGDILMLGGQAASGFAGGKAAKPKPRKVGVPAGFY